VGSEKEIWKLNLLFQNLSCIVREKGVPLHSQNGIAGKRPLSKAFLKKQRVRKNYLEDLVFQKILVPLHSQSQLAKGIKFKTA
jgi:hypothetical protein